MINTYVLNLIALDACRADLVRIDRHTDKTTTVTLAGACIMTNIKVWISLKVHGSKVTTFHSDPRPFLWRWRAPADIDLTFIEGQQINHHHFCHRYPWSLVKWVYTKEYTASQNQYTCIDATRACAVEPTHAHA